MLGYVTKLMGSTGLGSLSFDIGEEQRRHGLWHVHTATHRTTGELATAFVAKKSEVGGEWQTCTNALGLAKRLRHPQIATFKDGVETDTQCVIVTEQLDRVLCQGDFCSLVTSTGEDRDRDMFMWGIYCVGDALSFLKHKVQVSHGAVCPENVWITASGEWRLFGFEHTSAHPISRPVGIPPLFHVPQEKGTQSDAYQYGTLILSLLFQLDSSSYPGSLSHFLRMAGPMRQLVKEASQLVATRASSGCDLVLPTANANWFVMLNLDLQRVALLSDEERQHMFSTILSSHARMTPAFKQHRLIPELLQLLGQGQGSAAIAPLVLDVASTLGKTRYARDVLPVLTRLLTSPERAMRVAILNSMDMTIPNLEDSFINTTLYTSLASGFTDTSPSLREMTLKGMLSLAPALNDANKAALLRSMAGLQHDPEFKIRANTAICLAKLAGSFDAQSRLRGVLPGLLRSLKDPHPACRTAAVMGLGAVADHLTAQEIACQLLPNLCPVLVDPDVSVREQNGPVIRALLTKIDEKLTRPDSPTEVDVPQVTSASASLLSWAKDFSQRSLFTEKQNAPHSSSTPAPSSVPNPAPSSLHDLGVPASQPTSSPSTERVHVQTTAARSTVSGLEKVTNPIKPNPMVSHPTPQPQSKSDTWGDEWNNWGPDTPERTAAPAPEWNNELTAAPAPRASEPIAAGTADWDEDFEWQGLAPDPLPVPQPKPTPTTPAEVSAPTTVDWDEFDEDWK